MGLRPELSFFGGNIRFASSFILFPFGPGNGKESDKNIFQMTRQIQPGIVGPPGVDKFLELKFDPEQLDIHIFLKDGAVVGPSNVVGAPGRQPINSCGISLLKCFGIAGRPEALCGRLTVSLNIESDDEA